MPRATRVFGLTRKGWAVLSVWLGALAAWGALFAGAALAAEVLR